MNSFYFHISQARMPALLSSFAFGYLLDRCLQKLFPLCSHVCKFH